MRKEIIDEFFTNNEEIKQRIKRISENYTVSDFVKVTEDVRDYMQNKDASGVDGVYGCIYNVRKGYLRLNIESVESRLTNEYLDYLKDILKANEEIDKAFYIVAYHYLTLTKQLGYVLTATNNSDAPFPFIGEEMSPLGKNNYLNLCEILNGRCFSIVNYIGEDDLKYYNSVYRECGWYYHSTKHFSLIEELEGFVKMVSRCEFDYEFEKVLNLFVFKYRAIYTGERLHSYISREKEEKVISNLVDI